MLWQKRRIREQYLFMQKEAKETHQRTYHLCWVLFFTVVLTKEGWLTASGVWGRAFHTYVYASANMNAYGELYHKNSETMWNMFLVETAVASLAVSFQFTHTFTQCFWGCYCVSAYWLCSFLALFNISMFAIIFMPTGPACSYVCSRIIDLVFCWFFTYRDFYVVHFLNSAS